MDGEQFGVRKRELRANLGEMVVAGRSIKVPAAVQAKESAEGGWEVGSPAS